MREKAALKNLCLFLVGRKHFASNSLHLLSKGSKSYNQISLKMSESAADIKPNNTVGSFFYERLIGIESSINPR